MTIILSIFLLFAVAVCIFFVIFFLAQILATFTTDAPFVSIPDGIDDQITENLNLSDDGVLFDLGCGDGRVLINASKHYPGVCAIGVEKALLPYFLAKFYARKFKNIQIKREDIFKTDISSATHIFVYLYPQVITRLISNIRNQCKKGTKIISCDFEISGVIPEKVTEIKQRKSKKL